MLKDTVHFACGLVLNFTEVTDGLRSMEEMVIQPPCHFARSGSVSSRRVHEGAL